MSGAAGTEGRVEGHGLVCGTWPPPSSSLLRGWPGQS